MEDEMGERTEDREPGFVALAKRAENAAIQLGAAVGKLDEIAMKLVGARPVREEFAGKGDSHEDCVRGHLTGAIQAVEYQTTRLNAIMERL